MAKEFENHENGHSPVEFLGSGNCFDALSHIPNVYAVDIDIKRRSQEKE